MKKNISSDLSSGDNATDIHLLIVYFIKWHTIEQYVQHDM